MHADTGSLLGGQPEDFEALFERIRPRVVLWIASHMSPTMRAKTDPEDIAQEVLFCVHRDFAKFTGSGREEFHRWLFTIAANRIKDQVRHDGAQKRTPRIAGEEVNEVLIDEARDAAGGGFNATLTTPSQAAGRSEALREMEEAITHLTPRHRMMIRLRKLEQRPYEEVCEIMELATVGAARTLYFRAFGALRKKMRDLEEGEGSEGEVGGES